MALSNCYFMIATPALVLNWLSKYETGKMAPEVFAIIADMESGNVAKAVEEIQHLQRTSQPPKHV